MNIKIELSCRKCRIKLTKGTSINDPKEVHYYCKKCNYTIIQILKVNTGLQSWQRKKQ